MMKRRLGIWTVVLALSAAAGLCLTSPRADAAGLGPGGNPRVQLDTVVNGQPAVTSSDARPAQLFPDHATDIRITVSNTRSSTLNVSAVRLEGNVLDLPLFSYDSSVDLTVPPGSTKSLTFPVSMSGIGTQATGLIVASIALLGAGGQTLVSQSLVTNVHGSLSSLYGLFGLVVLVLTLTSLLLASLALARHTLPQNRWLRALRFLIPGFGIGLVMTFTMSAFDVFAPGPGHWLSLLIVCSGAGLAVGYLTPAPDEEEFDDYDDDVLLAQIVVVDDDPLEVDGQSRTTTDLVAPVTAGSGVPDSRPTAAP